MARLPRLVLPGLAHYVVLRGHNGGRVITDTADRDAFLNALRDAMTGIEIAVHAVALLDTEVHLLLRPHTADAVARVVQTLGRRYVGWFNQRHQRRGTLWDGRYRAAVVEPGDRCLFALCRVVQLAMQADASAEPLADASSPRSHLLVTAPPELWALGNTPFEREAAYREVLAQALSPALLVALDAAVRGGRVFGTAAYVQTLARDLQRPLVAAKPGRPMRRAPADDLPLSPARSPRRTKP